MKQILSARRFFALAVAATVVAAAITAPAQAYPLSMRGAEQASSAAVAPAPIELVRCFRQPGVGGPEGRRRALCIVVHGTHDGQTCRSFVLVRSPRGTVSSAGSARASLHGSYVCLPAFTGIEP